MKLKLIFLSLITIAISTLLFSGSANAAEYRSGSNVDITKNDFIDSSLYTSASKQVIDGIINGNFYCFGSDVTISGTVNGNVYCATQNIKIPGRVNGDLSIFSSSVDLSGTINGSVMAFASNFKSTQSARIRQDLSVSAQDVELEGIIARDVSINATNTKIGATIGRNLSATTNKLTFSDNAYVRGNVDYTSPTELSRQQNTKIDGKINKTNQSALAAGGIASIILGFLGFVLSLLIVSISTVLVFPSFYEKTFKQVKTNAGATIGWGFFNLLVVPFIIAIIMATIFGIPLAGLIAVAWILSLMLSGPVFAYYVGKRINKKARPLKAMFIGSFVVLALYAIPIVNVVVGLIVGVVGSGAIFNLVKTSKLKVKN